MSKTVKEIIITVILIFVLIGLVINNLKGRSKRKPSKPQISPQVAEEKLPPRPFPEEIIKKQKERAESLAWGRDPFQHIEEEKDKGYYRTKTLVLKGITLGKDGRGFAFIDDDIVKVGDTVGGYEVIQILKDKVLLRRENEDFYLTLTEE